MADRKYVVLARFDGETDQKLRTLQATRATWRR